MRRLIITFRLTNVIPERIIFVSQGITVFDNSVSLGRTQGPPSLYLTFYHHLVYFQVSDLVSYIEALLPNYCTPLTNHNTIRRNHRHIKPCASCVNAGDKLIVSNRFLPTAPIEFCIVNYHLQYPVSATHR